MEAIAKTIIFGLLAAAAIAISVMIAKVAIDVLIIIMAAIWWVLKLAAAITALAGLGVVLFSAIDKVAGGTETSEGV